MNSEITRVAHEQPEPEIKLYQVMVAGADGLPMDYGLQAAGSAEEIIERYGGGDVLAALPDDLPENWREMSLAGGKLVNPTRKQKQARQTAETIERLKVEEQELLAALEASDYKAIKYLEGEIAEDEYASVREERAQCRTRINEIRVQLPE